MTRPLKAFMIAAPSSGAGKTTLTMGLIAALRKRGLTVQPFKVGPDYIDPAYHSALAGRTCINLDTWMTDEAFATKAFELHCAGADVAVVEGVMGLFDGKGDRGSSAHVAKLLDLPVILTVDAKKAAQSVAATLYGFENFDPEVNVSGVIFNQIASTRHWGMVEGALNNRCKAEALGYLPKNPELALPERQLGLVSAHEHGLPETYLDLLVGEIEEHIDLDRLLDSAASKKIAEAVPSIKQESTVRLGIARDEAFCFYYQDNLDLLEQAGIELVPFSPINDSVLPENIDGLYFGGGFPEEFTGRLAQNRSMLESVRNFSGKILAECGGLIYLTKPFAGLINGTIEMTDKLQACGYREVSFNRDTILGTKGTKLRGHEFHWSKWVEKPSEGYGALQTEDKAWGYADDCILASYFHIHFASNPTVITFFKETLAG